jgi:hypothetical protein
MNVLVLHMMAVILQYVVVMDHLVMIVVILVMNVELHRLVGIQLMVVLVLMDLVQ